MTDARLNVLPYGIAPNSPATIQPIDTIKWSQQVVPTARHYFTERHEELVRQYQALISEYELNRLVYDSTINIEPVIGEVYYLYERRDGSRFLSMIAPESTFWKNCLAKVRLNSRYVWEKV